MRMLVGGTTPTQQEMARLLKVYMVSDEELRGYILELQVEVARLDMKLKECEEQLATNNMKLKECEEQLATNNQNNDGYIRLG
jgi:hypothetical protein